jgi:hypothetical protein
MIIGVDFDGTIVTHDFPDIGKPLDLALETLKELVANGHKLVLFTMRSAQSLQDAVDYLTQNGVELWGVNTNPDQASWTSSPKAYCHIYIDDAALGCPLHYDSSLHERPFVDWRRVRIMLAERVNFEP